MSIKDGPGEGGWSVFASKVVEERDAALAQVAALRHALKSVVRIDAALGGAMFIEAGQSRELFGAIAAALADTAKAAAEHDARVRAAVSMEWNTVVKDALQKAREARAKAIHELASVMADQLLESPLTGSHNERQTRNDVAAWLRALAKTEPGGGM